MNEIFLSPYNPKVTEERIYQVWEKSGFFNPDICIEKGVTKKDAPHFSIVLPPPNVTGTLHMGHALEGTIQDIAVRYNRMLGKRTLWVPGTDHAAIATESKVAKLIEKEEGKRKHDFSREEFLARVEKFASDSHDTIVGQVRRMGASLDWSREAFTLDDKRNFAVRTTFKRMYDDGIIYRGGRIVNWDPKGQTTISDDELVYKEEKTKFYYFQYGPFVIGTARPETKFGDKYVVMHPDDTRYTEYTHGQKLQLEWINGPIEATIIKDKSIDMTFGTGVMTITPWHSAIDFDIAERHGLDKEQIIDLYGKLLPIAGEFAGMKIKDAREKIVEKLRGKGLVVKEEDYTHNIATAERTEATVEPQIMRQWWVNVHKEFPFPHDSGLFPKGTLVTLKDLMLRVIQKEAGENFTSIIPDRFEKIYTHWIENLHDWCISRQIWYGHRIPVWYKTENGEEKMYCGIEVPDGEGWEQDPDTLDTWFSSALWTFSTLGWPDEKSPDFLAYHPTSFMCPGYEILFFWVARMILMSTYLLGVSPFKTVYLHGILRDKDGFKFSKSRGNGIDPLVVADEYGADALRMALTVGIGPGNDSKFDIQKVKAYKLFGNKIWNITRFILSNLGEYTGELGEIMPHDEILLSEFATFKADITDDMNNLRFYLATEKLYHYLWHTFADVVIENSKEYFKTGGDAALSRAHTLYTILTESLKMLHPFMPFITEEIWGHLPYKKTNLLLITPW